MMLLQPSKLVIEFWATQVRRYGISTVTAIIFMIGFGAGQNYLSKFICLVGGIASLGSIVGIAASSYSFQTYSDRLIADHQQQLDDQSAQFASRLTQSQIQATQFEQLFEQSKDELAEAIGKGAAYKTEADTLAIQLTQLQDAIAAQQQQLTAEAQHQRHVLRSSLATKLKSLRRRLRQRSTNLNRRKNHDRIAWKQQAIASLNDQWETLLAQAKADYEQRIDAITHQYTALNAKYQELAEYLEGLLNKQQSWHSAAEGQFQTVQQEKNAVIDQLFKQLNQYHAAKTFTGSTKADINGNKLIDFFLEQGMTCDADRCESHYEFDEVWIRPRTDTIESLQKLASTIQQRFELLKPPEFAIDKGCIKVIMRTHSKEKLAGTTIEEQPETWLETTVRASNHYRIAAPTDTGKSVLLDNLINCLKLIHGNEFCCDLLDPKYPFTEWSGGITPTYTKFSGCISGMEKLGAIIQSRLDEAEFDVKAGRSIRVYPAHLFAIDELEVLVDEARDLDDGAMKGKQSMRLIRLLRKGLKLGRGLTTQKGKGVLVAYITQSPLCSRINLNKDDFDNSTNIFLGENIPRALAEELNNKLSDKELAYLMRQYELRRDRGDVYFCLVKTPKQAFIATLPSQGYYAQQLQKDATETEPAHDNCNSIAAPAAADRPASKSIGDGNSSELAAASRTLPQAQFSRPIDSAPQPLQCPQCQSLSIKSGGSKRGVRYSECKDCGKKFRTPA